MEKLTEKKRKWIIQQFRAGRSATIIAKIQRISRRMVYKLSNNFKREGISAYNAKKAGRPSLPLNQSFVKKVIDIRKRDDYGAEKLHFVLKREGFIVSQRQIQKILDQRGLTEPCVKRRGQRTYVRYQWPISNYLWHVDWTTYKGKLYCAFIDDRSRKIMAAGEFNNAIADNAKFVLYQAILDNGVCPVIILSDKGSQFYANKHDKTGKKGISEFEKELEELGIEFWTSRRNHPQTNGKMEKWFDTLKKRKKRHPEESLQDFVKWYNNERIHHALDYNTPEEVYKENL
ncbi:TPA: transposase [Candidatus Woesearchaeota archaeon]|nr:DDE-type integrase/transposase/recombinase [Candidatus Woesearchaeota archaeon]HIH31702.1 transposase [Candidatus Woesearchaeota archaeon]HIH54965.1 transposase [Candidatus Woesearchaeota archaeon]HIJ13604.1 transposase [Candidatus Woesearchaeota archaeon]